MNPAHTYLACRYDGCAEQATVVIVTIREGFCFERCERHARMIVDPVGG